MSPPGSFPCSRGFFSSSHWGVILLCWVVPFSLCGEEPFWLSDLPDPSRPSWVITLGGSHSQGFWDSQGVLRNSDLSLVEMKGSVSVYLPLFSPLYGFIQIPYGGRLLDRTEPGSYDLMGRGFFDPYGELGFTLLSDPRVTLFGGWSPSLGTPHLFLTATEPTGSVPMGTGSQRLIVGIRMILSILGTEGEGVLFYEHPLPSEGFFYVEPVGPLLRYPPLKRLGYRVRFPVPLSEGEGAYLSARGFHELAKSFVNAHELMVGLFWRREGDLFEIEFGFPLYGKDYPLPPPWNFLEPDPYVGFSLRFRWITGGG